MTAISIVIPAFNAADYIEECIGSIATQTFDDYEVVIIDDGSTDDTGALCNHMAESNERIRVVHIANTGASNARNMGAALAQGDYIWFVDADDLIAEGSLERLSAEIERTHADCILFDSMRLYEDGHRVYAPLFSEPFYAAGSAELSDLQRFFLYPHVYERHAKKVSTGYAAPWTKLFKSELLRANGTLFDPSLTVFEDGMFTLRAIDSAESVFYLAESLYLYRYLPGSTIHSYSDDLDIRRMKAFAAIDGWLNETGKDATFFDAFHCHVISHFGGLLSRFYLHPSRDLDSKSKWQSVRDAMRSEPFSTAMHSAPLHMLRQKDRLLALSGRLNNLIGLRLYSFVRKLTGGRG